MTFFLYFRFAKNDGPGRLDLRNFDLNNLVEEKMYIKPSGEIQIANGYRNKYK